jgi:hypothetical protein
MGFPKTFWYEKKIHEEARKKHLYGMQESKKN